MKLEVNNVYNMDCIVGMQQIEDKSIDMILCDLPYGTTDCRWDSIIPFDLLWKEYERIIKDNGAIVLTSAQPFTTKLIGSNQKLFRYCWYWIKNCATGFPFAKYQPMRNVEDICVFYKKVPTYNPQGLIKLDKPIVKQRPDPTKENVYKMDSLTGGYVTRFTNYPRQTLEIKCQREGLHPTQKPVELFKYLILTYTNVGDTVLDNCIGSGTTAVACIETNRNFIGFELDEKHYNTCIKRISKYQGST
ncbi:DNA methyltransferase [Paludicola sp. MB14-C6]|uniref:DNA-methyltransferase n=1 Tax=Paludihabitans sp. MB14-C6 TaxID=3070656 RepID=UPI0027DE8EDA|nr:DNA methyltransferase [Paludicola sp. MB14-C6]WMJ23470.1 DNA methyltransferase [Paludicola sp. MB14-C6]